MSACWVWAGGVALVAAVAAAPVVAQLGPQNVVREFCRLDAVGARATLQGWGRVAPLVQWPWEPAWDRVVLITSYTVGWPIAEEQGKFAIEVRYAVQGVVSAAGLREQTSVESRVFRVEPSDDGFWRIAGPPPPPHVFLHDVDVEAMRRSLAEGGVNFIANSLLVHRLFRQAGWDIPFLSVSELARGEVFREVPEAKAGDLVLYLDGDEPYHVAVLEQEGVVVSATLNAGVVRTSLDAFPGGRKTLRLVEPMPTPTPTPFLPLAKTPEATRSPRQPAMVQRRVTPRAQPSRPASVKRRQRVRRSAPARNGEEKRRRVR